MTEEIKKEFDTLHHDIVNSVIDFCKKHNIEADEFAIGADFLNSSIEYGKWCPSTDSFFRLDDSNGKTILCNI